MAELAGREAVVSDRVGRSGELVGETEAGLMEVVDNGSSSPVGS